MNGRIGVLLPSVRNFPEMFSFYRDKLGLQTSKTDPGKGYEPLRDWVRFEFNRSDETAIELFDEAHHPRKTPAPYPRDNSFIVAIRVEDIKATYSELKSRGVEFKREIREEQWGWYIHFEDPDGKRLQLYQLRPGY